MEALNLHSGECDREKAGLGVLFAEVKIRNANTISGIGVFFYGAIFSGFPYSASGIPGLYQENPRPMISFWRIQFFVYPYR
jgi:hypothetical protein